jgi:hypothetical protein
MRRTWLRDRQGVKRNGPTLHAFGCRSETRVSTATKSIDNGACARAEASFRKEERAKDGAKAMMEYQARA